MIEPSISASLCPSKEENGEHYLQFKVSAAVPDLLTLAERTELVGRINGRTDPSNARLPNRMGMIFKTNCIM